MQFRSDIASQLSKGIQMESPLELDLDYLVPIT